jgi:hypothetical protein
MSSSRFSPISPCGARIAPRSPPQLREAYGADDDAVAFFDFFANRPADFEARALTVLNEGLSAGDSPVAARRASRLLQAYELAFWDALTQWL